jgi:hypothetical protein
MGAAPPVNTVVAPNTIPIVGKMVFRDFESMSETPPPLVLRVVDHPRRGGRPLTMGNPAPFAARRASLRTSR